MIKINKMKNKGFSLIEIIVSIAILGIIAVSFLPMFTAGIKGIVKAGNRSSTSYISQETVENKILEGATDTEIMELKVEFGTSPSITITQTGEEVTIGSIKLFIPKY